MITVHYKKYKCDNCESEDTVKLFENEQAPLAFHCWKCHAGSQHPNQLAQSHARAGMLPVEEEEAITV